MDPATAVLRLDAVSRVFPRDVSQLASSVMREMFLPSSALRVCPPTHFHALREIGICLQRGEKAGILGAHRSGKTTLAAIAAGLMQPTSGSVDARARRSLIARPGAGFRPGLSVINNLSFRAKLHGLSGDEVRTHVGRTLSLCSVTQEQAVRAIANLSPYVARQLGLTLMLELPADIVIVDEVTGAGTGEARWELRGRLQDKVESSTSLVLSGDANFMRDMVSRSWVLHSGRLYGPFDVEEAIHAFEMLPPERMGDGRVDESFDPMVPPSIGAGSVALMDAADYEDPSDEGIGDATGEPDREDGAGAPRRKGPAAPWTVVGITVDGDEFLHSRLSLLGPPGTSLRVTLEMMAHIKQDFTGGMFTLHGGNSGSEIGRFHLCHESTPVNVGDRMSLSFEMQIPDWGEDFYGLTFCPQFKGKHFVPLHRLKILVFGVGRKHQDRPERILDIRISSFERKLHNGSVDTVPEGQQTSGEMGQEIQAPT